MSVRNSFRVEYRGLCIVNTFLTCVAHGAVAMEDCEERRRQQARE